MSPESSRMPHLVMPLGFRTSLKARMASGTPDLERIVGVHQQDGVVGVDLAVGLEGRRTRLGNICTQAWAMVPPAGTP